MPCTDEYRFRCLGLLKVKELFRVLSFIVPILSLSVFVSLVFYDGLYHSADGPCEGRTKKFSDGSINSLRYSYSETGKT